MHLDGERRLSCLTLAVQADGREVTTIEGIGTADDLHPVQQAFIDCDAFQCGACTAGQVMSAAALLDEDGWSSADDVRELMSGNLCRCGAYPRIVDAVLVRTRAPRRPDVRDFTYVLADDVAIGRLARATDAVARAVQTPDDVAYVAGGTTQYDLMRDGVWSPGTLVDISRLPLADIEVTDDVLVVGATVTMADLARHPAVADIDVLRDSLLLAASPQLRTMATVGGNVLQRTRCRYFRDPDGHAVQQAGARQRLRGDRGHRPHPRRARRRRRLHRRARLGPRGRPGRARRPGPAPRAGRRAGRSRSPSCTCAPTRTRRATTSSPPASCITHLEMPGAGRPDSGYLKVRDRASYEFALTSAAVVARRRGRRARARRASASVASGRCRGAPPAPRTVLRGRRASLALFEEAAAAELADAFTVPGTAFKPELARRTLVRQLRDVTEVTA